MNILINASITIVLTLTVGYILFLITNPGIMSLKRFKRDVISSKNKENIIKFEFLKIFKKKPEELNWHDFQTSAEPENSQFHWYFKDHRRGLFEDIEKYKMLKKDRKIADALIYLIDVIEEDLYKNSWNSRHKEEVREKIFRIFNEHVLSQKEKYYNHHGSIIFLEELRIYLTNQDFLPDNKQNSLNNLSKVLNYHFQREDYICNSDNVYSKNNYRTHYDFILKTLVFYLPEIKKFIEKENLSIYFSEIFKGDLITYIELYEGAITYMSKRHNELDKKFKESFSIVKNYVYKKTFKRKLFVFISKIKNIIPKIYIKIEFDGKKDKK